jgi:hypothetical protein
MTEALEVSPGGVNRFLSVIPDRAWVDRKVRSGEVVIVEEKVTSNAGITKN